MSAAKPAGDARGGPPQIGEGVRSLTLTSRWRRLCAEVGSAPEGGDGILDALAARYTEPHRRYHTLAHIGEVLASIDELLSANEPAADPCAIELAAWFHDAVYDPQADDNEARSAQLAIEMLGEAGVGADRLRRVSDLVLATEHHVPDGPDAAVLVDADLAVLGSDRERYLAYAADVRAEYAAYDDERYCEGRAAVLRGLLERPLLYHTASMRRWRGQQAKANLSAELEALRRGTVPASPAAARPPADG